MRGELINVGAGLLLATILGLDAAEAARQGPIPAFKSSVDLVRVAAVARDRKGRFVRNLTVRDFEVLEGGQLRPITDFRSDLSGVSVALLIDISGSMEGRLGVAREAASHVLSWLEPVQDEAAIFSFDTRLNEVTPFTAGLKGLPESMTAVVPFGATSLHDAIAATAERVGAREGRRRAVIVFTDGDDTASRLTPSQVSAAASGIDVPVYIVGVVLSVDNPSEEASIAAGQSPFAGPLEDLARWTGGDVFVASSPVQRSIAARRILDELRHQYLIAFESSGIPGWHPLVVRAHGKDLVVRARSGYNAGQSRP